MCILSASVNRVANTNIFVCPSEDGRRQLIVYSNLVDTDVEKNTMVLPVPNPESVEFLNLSSYKLFFRDCEKSFVRRREEYRYDSLMVASRSAAIDENDPPLPVHTVGSYRVSIVPTIDEFHRLNSDEFDIHHQLPDLLRSKYDASFGYLVCKLKAGSHAYHPFAYTHRLHLCNLLFVPTFHFHPGHSRHDVHADWDHNLYSIGTDLDQSHEYSFSGHKLKFHKLPPEFQWIGHYKMIRDIVIGDKPNRDYWLCKEKGEPVIRPLSPPSSPPQPPYNYQFPISGPGGVRNIRRAFGL